LLRAIQSTRRLLRDDQVVVAVPYRVGEVLALALWQRFEPEVAQRLQHPVARFAVGFAHHHERLVDERHHEVEHVLRHQRLGAAHCFGRRKVEAADEHAEPLEQSFSLSSGGRTTTRPARAASAGARAARGRRRQQREAVVQALVDFLIDSERMPRRRELQRERNAFDSRAKLRDGRRLALGQREPGLLQLRRAP
jgi:hypothetical protein